MTATIQATDTSLADAGVEIEHHFGREGRSTTYIKRTKIPQGARLLKHTHSFDHHSVVASGAVIVRAAGREEIHEAGSILLIEAGVEHEVEAVTDAIWLCIHGTSETDPSKIDHTLVEGGH